MPLKLTECVVLSQRIEKDVESCHLETSFLFLLLLDDVLDHWTLSHLVLARWATNFRSLGTALRTPVWKAAKLDISVEHLHRRFYIINLNLIKLTVLFDFIPAQIIIEIAKSCLSEAILFRFIFRTLGLQILGHILKNWSLRVNFLQYIWLQEFSAGFSMSLGFFKLKFFL